MESDDRREYRKRKEVELKKNTHTPSQKTALFNDQSLVWFIFRLLLV